MNAPQPLVSMVFSIVAGVVGLNLYLGRGWNVILCILVCLPIVTFGIWLDSYLQEKAFGSRG